MTGASSDTGMEFLDRNGRSYSLIYAHYNHMNDHLREIVRSFGPSLIPLKADLKDPKETEALLDAVRERGVYPDHFIHLSSGEMLGEKFHKRDSGDFLNSFTISTVSVVTLLKDFLPKMMKNRYGRVILMLSSVTVNNPPKYQSSYVTSKYALLGLMKSLSQEYASKGITVNGISPDMMDTKFLRNVLKKEVVLKENAARNPLGRNIEISDVLPVMEYLLSDAAQAVTGQNIAVTGGII